MSDDWPYILANASMFFFIYQQKQLSMKSRYLFFQKKFAAKINNNADYKNVCTCFQIWSYRFIILGSGTESQTVILTPPLANVTEYENTTLNCTLPGEISYWIVPNSNKTYPLEYKQGTCNKDYPWNQTQLLFVFCSTGFFSVTLINVNRSRHREQWICAYYDLLTDTYTNSSTTILVNGNILF